MVDDLGLNIADEECYITRSAAQSSFCCSFHAESVRQGIASRSSRITSTLETRLLTAVQKAAFVQTTGGGGFVSEELLRATVMQTEQNYALQYKIPDPLIDGAITESRSEFGNLDGLVFARNLSQKYSEYLESLL